VLVHQPKKRAPGTGDGRKRAQRVLWEMAQRGVWEREESDGCMTAHFYTIMPERLADPPHRCRLFENVDDQVTVLFPLPLPSLSLLERQALLRSRRRH